MTKRKQKYLVVLIIVRVLLLRPIRVLDHAMGAVAAGDLQLRVAGRSGDELGRLAQRFNQMVRDLARLVQERSARHVDAHALGVDLGRVGGVRARDTPTRERR